MIDTLLQSLASYAGRRVVVAMSGGVDSSIAAVLLQRAGAEVIGVHMRTWHYNDCDDTSGLASCCSPADARDAQRVAGQFDFPFYAIDVQVNFRSAVIDPFIADYLAGRTPNPCVNCNNKLKLGSLLGRARAWDANIVATGHYGRIARNAASGRFELATAADAAKDQTYYLFGLTQDQLAHLALPLGGLTKGEAREIARDLGLHLHDKPDSQEICFVTDNDYRRFLREEAGLDPATLAGAIVDTKGNVLGCHEGVHNYTIGQRRGLGIAAPAPLYVVDLDPESHTVIVGTAEEILCREFELDGLNWVGLAPTSDPFRAQVKIRSRTAPFAATVQPLGKSGARVIFDRPVAAVTPGQAAVAYDEGSGATVLAGGWIRRRIDEAAA